MSAGNTNTNNGVLAAHDARVAGLLSELLKSALNGCGVPHAGMLEKKELAEALVQTLVANPSNRRLYLWMWQIDIQKLLHEGKFVWVGVCIEIEHGYCVDGNLDVPVDAFA
jgi:hypothetical protein